MDREHFQKVPVNGVLDLHTFRPNELGSLIPEYIEACLNKKIYKLRIIHGKGAGNLRRSVHASLKRNAHVKNYNLAADRSGWGATVVVLKC